MSDYNRKKDLIRLFFVFKTIALIVVIFALFIAVVILPVFLLSQHQPAVYTLLFLAVVALIAIYFTIRKINSIYLSYRSINYCIQHICLNFLLPLLIVIFFIVFEAFIVKLFFSRFSTLIATTIIIGLNLVTLVLLFLSLKYVHHWKQYLKKKRIKE